MLARISPTLARISPTLAHLAAALIPVPAAAIALYPCRLDGGYWRIHVSHAGQRHDNRGATPFEAIANAAAFLLGVQPHPAVSPAARAAYRRAWAASQGQAVAARFAAAEQAARQAATMETCDECGGDGCLWVLRADGRDQPGPTCPTCKGQGEVPATLTSDDDDDTGRDYEQELAADFYAQAFD